MLYLCRIYQSISHFIEITMKSVLSRITVSIPFGRLGSPTLHTYFPVMHEMSRDSHTVDEVIFRCIRAE